MNQRADRLADKGADLGAPALLALTRFQDDAKLVAVVQRMAVRLVDARDHLEQIAPEVCNSNMEAGEVQDMQSKQWYRPMLRHQTQEKYRSRLIRCNPLTEMLWQKRGYDNETTQDEHHSHAKGTSHACVKLRRPHTLGRRRAWQRSGPTLKEDRSSRLANRLSWRSLRNKHRG